MKKERNKNPVQPVSGTKVPRYAGPSTFARLPELRDVESCDVAIVGIPFDSGTSYRPGARFGPQSIRQASRHLRTNYHPSYDVEPFKVQQVHFDAHLDTWDTYFGAPYTHGTPFRRAREENLFLDDASMHVGIRGPLYSRDDIKNDESFGFKIIHCDEFQTEGTDKIAERIKKRVGDNALYLSIDIDVLDPAFAPGTGTPEIAGMTTREMVNVLRGLSGLNLISADVVEVAPAYDHAEVTSLAAATIVYELTNLFAKS